MNLPSLIYFSRKARLQQHFVLAMIEVTSSKSIHPEDAPCAIGVNNEEIII
jgi:hypothetical protein